jgi:thiol-disulfide isomerase/thioredoxin
MRRLLCYWGFCLFFSAAWCGETDQYGNAHDLTTPCERYTVVDFAASWCVPCWKVLPKLQALSEERPDLRVLAVSVDKKKEGRDKLVKRLNLTLPVIWDEKHALAERFNPPGMPSTFVLNPKGEIVYQHTGYTKKTWQEFLQYLETLPSREKRKEEEQTPPASGGT